MVGFRRIAGDRTLGSIQLRRNFSRNILIRMVILSLIIAGMMVWKFEFINEVYFRNQLTSTGLIINGGIVGLFTVGILRMITIFLHYMREENALLRFLRNLREGQRDPLDKLPTKSIIAIRFRTMQGLYKANCPINHGSLASTLLATESTRNSLPRFINNILILTGVFGTIVSLSIALIGASDLLESSVNVGGMGMVVHGMSTALSTTITAIVCFIFFGYFHLKLTDVQTNLVSAVEQVTVNELMPALSGAGRQRPLRIHRSGALPAGTGQPDVPEPEDPGGPGAEYPRYPAELRIQIRHPDLRSGRSQIPAETRLPSARGRLNRGRQLHRSASQSA